MYVLSVYECTNDLMSSANSLKNLFYRILHLYSAGVNLVFIIEGAAPSPIKMNDVATEKGRENFMKKVGEASCIRIHAVFHL